MADILLEVQQLTKSFSSRKVVDEVSFTVRQGQTIGLLGPNGAGKSSTVNMICGLLQADSGYVKLSGQTISGGNNQAKRKLGLVPQDLALFEDLSARENLKIFGALYGLSGQQLQTRCDAVLELVSLSDRAKDKPATFSGGMKRRLNIAAALLHEPELLILDEPTVGVDPQSRNAIFDALEILKSQGRSLIYTSHYMEEVERLADHIVIIDHGKVIANESPADLFKRLPAHAALELQLPQALTAQQVQNLRQQAGVVNVESKDQDLQLSIALSDGAYAINLLNYLQREGIPFLHFATAKTNLEDVFLKLTGRTLRD